MRPLFMAILAAGCAALPGHAGSVPNSDRDFCSLERLTEEYLSCEQRARYGPLNLGDAAWCSELYETLKSRRFDGDAAALRAWYRKRTSGAPDIVKLPRQADCTLAGLL